MRLLYIACNLLLLFHCQHGWSFENDFKRAIAVTDFRNKQLQLEKPAQRIVCLIESALSGLYMLGAEDKIVGISTAVYKENVAPQYAAMDDRIKEKIIPAPGNWDFVNIESVITLQPDLIIIWASQKESIQSIEEKGIPVYGVELDSYNDIYKEILDLGILTGTEKRANWLIQYTQQEVERFSRIVHRDHTDIISVYYMWAQGMLESSGTQSTVNELLELAGAINACQAAQEHLVVNMENILSWNPDVIVMWYNETMDPEDVMAQSMWKYVNAVKNKRVYELPSVFFCDLWTFKFQYAVKLVAKWCYPKHFHNVNLELEKQRMLVNLYGSKGLKLIE